jgi:hypothetical protein
MKASKTAIWGLGILAAVCLAPDAKAQMVDAKARQKASWYNAPREIQIIDERPVVRDFREAPAAPQQIQLPPGPQGFGGPGGGGGGGAMGDGGGGSVLPAGGMPIGGGAGDPGYRGAPMSGLPLEHSGFGRHTNIPAGGMGPKVALPGGQTTGVHGSLMTPTAHTAGPAAGAGPRGAMGPARAAAGPAAASYGGNYTVAPSGGSGGGMSTSANVQGRLLNRLKSN